MYPNQTAIRLATSLLPAWLPEVVLWCDNTTRRPTGLTTQGRLACFPQRWRASELDITLASHGPSELLSYLAHFCYDFTESWRTRLAFGPDADMFDKYYFLTLVEAFKSNNLSRCWVEAPEFEEDEGEPNWSKLQNLGWADDFKPHFHVRRYRDYRNPNLLYSLWIAAANLQAFCKGVIPIAQNLERKTLSVG